MPRPRYSARSRFTWGILLLVFGAFALVVNMGVRIPRDMWDYWPVLLLIMGALQAIWPGSIRERMAGYWLLVVGFYGLVSTFEMFGLTWGTSWPILIVALGIRIVVGGLLRIDTSKQNENPGQPGGSAP